MLYIINNVVGCTLLLYSQVNWNMGSADFCGPSKEVIICELKNCTLQCGLTGSIQIVYASYGRTNGSTCLDRTIRNLNCSAPTAMQTISERCDNKTSCVVEATNSVFGDPCHNIYKYVNLTYRCSEKQEIPNSEPTTDKTEIIVATVVLTAIIVICFTILLVWRLKDKRADPDNTVNSVMNTNNSRSRHNAIPTVDSTVYQQNESNYCDHQYSDLSSLSQSQKNANYTVSDQRNYVDNQYSDLPCPRESTYYSVLN